MHDADVSFDGTYMTRGHMSTIGVATAVGLKTGKYWMPGVGARFIRKVYKCCQYWAKQDKNSDGYRRWLLEHRPHCTLTHQGSSGGMEAEIAKEVFGRSRGDTVHTLVAMFLEL
jgi:hypothetical protein